MKQNNKVVIFDFDGTMADSIPIIRNIYSDLAVKNKWKVLTDNDYETLRRGTLTDARKWAGIRFWQFPMLIRSAKRLMKIEAENVKLFPGMTELIHDLHRRGTKLYVLSRNATGTIDAVLERYNLHEEMTVLDKRKRSLGSKSAVISKLIQSNKYDRKDIWMVGDEVRDVQAANRSGVNSIAVSWGVQDTSILKNHEPTHVVDTISGLRRILEV